MLLNEFLMAFRAIDAHTEKFRFGLKFAPRIAQFTSLSRAPWGAVLRIEIKNQWRTGKIRKLDRLATAVDATDCRSLEVGSGITNFKFRRYRAHVCAGKTVTANGPSQSTSQLLPRQWFPSQNNLASNILRSEPPNQSFRRHKTPREARPTSGRR